MINSFYSMLNMVKSFIREYGIYVSWQEPIVEKNSRGEDVLSAGDQKVTAKVLFLKERFNPMKAAAAAVGLSHDHSRYIIALPEIKIRKDLIITDSHGIRWKLGPVDWIDIAGKPVAKQAPLQEVG